MPSFLRFLIGVAGPLIARREISHWISGRTRGRRTNDGRMARTRGAVFKEVNWRTNPPRFCYFGKGARNFRIITSREPKLWENEGSGLTGRSIRSGWLYGWFYRCSRNWNLSVLSLELAKSWARSLLPFERGGFGCRRILVFDRPSLLLYPTVSFVS